VSAGWQASKGPEGGGDVGRVHGESKALPLFRERMGSGDKNPTEGGLGNGSDFRFSDTLKSARALGLETNRKGSRRR